MTFQPGQIVTMYEGGRAVAGPVTVYEQPSPDRVVVVTATGLLTLPAGSVTFRANSIQELQAKEAQRHEEAISQLKSDVALKVMEAAESCGYAVELQDALEEAGVKVVTPRVTAVLHLTVEVNAELIRGSNGMSKLNMNNASNKEWWWNTLIFEDDGKDLQWKNDEDVAKAEVRLIGREIVEVRDSSYIEGED